MTWGDVLACIIIRDELPQADKLWSVMDLTKRGSITFGELGLRHALLPYRIMPKVVAGHMPQEP